MEIVEISDFKTKKVKISFDNGIALVLYKSDLTKYDISCKEYSNDEYNELVELTYKRALQRCIALLSVKDMTEAVLRDKLTDDGYIETVIDASIEKAKKERLIDDERFCRMYIEAKSLKKSKNDIIRELSAKGIDRDRALEIYDELKNDGELADESELIMKILEKKHYFDEENDFESSSKMIRYLLSKGFSYDSIRSAISEK